MKTNTLQIAVGLSVLLTSLATGSVAAEVDGTRPQFGIKVARDDWPWWRGPGGDGVAEPKQKPPLKWSNTENVAWKAAVPGRGHGSPIVIGNQVVLQTADEEKETQTVLSFDRQTGRPLWQTEVHTGGLEKKGNKKSTQASSTPACDGERIYVNFLNRGSMYTTALDLRGRRLWQKKVVEFATHQGFGSSPLPYQSVVLVTADSKAGGRVAALDPKQGTILWEDKRPQEPNYASPVVHRIGGKDQLFVQGCDLVAAYEPLTGKKLWEIPGSTTECVTSIVTDGRSIFVSGGYPKNHIQAIAADGSGKTVWENGARVYVPSMVVHQDHLFANQDEGVAACWNCRTGKQTWKSRLGGTFSGSLVLVGDRLYAVNEEGKAFVFRADPAKFELLAENQLGDEVLSTPAICGGRIYQRVAEKTDGRRQETLYCLGEK